MSPPPPVPVEPEQAIAVVQHLLQTPEQFAAGFADTTRVELVAGTPGPVEGAAGSRYAEIPVTVEATHRDGRRVRYVGHYTLRRAMVDGASAEQRAWHIASADLREAP